MTPIRYPNTCRAAKVMPGQVGQRLYGFVNFMDNANAEFAMMAMNGRGSSYNALRLCILLYITNRRLSDGVLLSVVVVLKPRL